MAKNGAKLQVVYCRYCFHIFFNFIFFSFFFEFLLWLNAAICLSFVKNLNFSLFFILILAFLLPAHCFACHICHIYKYIFLCPYMYVYSYVYACLFCRTFPYECVHIHKYILYMRKMFLFFLFCLHVD